METLLALKGTWVVLGVAIAGLIFYVANRRVFVMMGMANQLLANTYKETIKALTDERNDYKAKLHAEKEAHQASRLQITELSSRPDLGQMHAILTDQSKILRDIHTSFNSHIESDARVFKEITTALQKISAKIN